MLWSVGWEGEADRAVQHCAQTLLEFNGGSSCVQVYVNQHDFFINNVREWKDAEDTHWYVVSYIGGCSANE